MAVFNRSNSPSALGTDKVSITAFDQNLQSLKGSSGTLHTLRIINSSNSVDAAYVKFYDSASPTVGTTDPDFVFYAPKSADVKVAILEGAAFSNAMKAALLASGGTGGTKAPTRSVNFESILE